MDLPSPPQRPLSPVAEAGPSRPIRLKAAADEDPVITLSLRGDQVERATSRFPASAVRKAEQADDRYLDVSKADFHLFENVYRDRRISPRAASANVLRILSVANYLQDAFVRGEVKKFLPLRKAVHDSKGSRDYPRNLERLATELEALGEADAVMRKRARADRFRRAAQAEAEADAPALFVRGLHHALQAVQNGELENNNPRIDLDPQDAIDFNNQGVAQQQAGRLIEAAASYDRALELEPHYPEAYVNQALLHQRQGRFAEARAGYERALELDPHYPGAYVNRASLHQQQGRFDEAMADYNRAIELDPRCATAYSNLGILHQQQGRYREALAGYTRAIEVDPRYIEAYWNRASLLQLQQQQQHQQ